MEDVYHVTGNVNKNLKEVNEMVIAKNETEAIRQIWTKYGEGQYDATKVKGKLNG